MHLVNQEFWWRCAIRFMFLLCPLKNYLKLMDQEVRSNFKILISRVTFHKARAAKDIVIYLISSVQSLSCVRLFATPWISACQAYVHDKLLESTQTHVHQVSDAIQPSHPLLPPSPSAPNPSQHQGLFQWVNSSHEVAKVLEFQLQHQSF